MSTWQHLRSGATPFTWLVLAFEVVLAAASIVMGAWPNVILCLIVVVMIVWVTVFFEHERVRCYWCEGSGLEPSVGRLWEGQPCHVCIGTGIHDTKK